MGVKLLRKENADPAESLLPYKILIIKSLIIKIY